MRSETEMMNLILNTAKNDARIRAVIMNGSRANPNAPRDIFQDYDIVYIVKNLDEFIKGYSYVDIFGPRLMLQMPETMREPMGDGRFTYLTLLADGNRIDLQIIPIEKWKMLVEKDSESILLLDKDGLLPPFPPNSDKDYHINPPTENDYFSCCNNFWWCLQNVAKGIWRDELLFAMDMYHHYVRDELNGMVEWYIGTQYDFAVSAGKKGKYFKRFLTEDEYTLYCKTYTNGDSQCFWDGIFQMCKLFGQLARKVGGYFGFSYLEADEKNMTAYLEQVRRLPPDAKAIF